MQSGKIRTLKLSLHASALEEQRAQSAVPDCTRAGIGGTRSGQGASDRISKIATARGKSIRSNGAERYIQSTLTPDKSLPVSFAPYP
jgi:hypothetical protein